MSDRPRLLDLFAGGGGAAMGYYRAGFDVVGVDIVEQPNYPFEFHRADARDVLRFLPMFETFDAIHASPPCQAYSATKTLHSTEYPRLVHDVRLLLLHAALPYVIENVVGAPLRDPVMLCGSSFGLGVRRHRLFECSFSVMVPPCAHPWQPEPIDVTGTGGPGGRHRKPKGLAHARAVMGVDWMTRPELSEAVPPAFTAHLGEQLIQVLALTSSREGRNAG